VLRPGPSALQQIELIGPDVLPPRLWVAALQEPATRLLEWPLSGAFTRGGRNEVQELEERIYANLRLRQDCTNRHIAAMQWVVGLYRNLEHMKLPMGQWQLVYILLTLLRWGGHAARIDRHSSARLLRLLFLEICF
jgi:hypothetical protein